MLQIDTKLLLLYLTFRILHQPVVLNVVDWLFRDTFLITEKVHFKCLLWVSELDLLAQIKAVRHGLLCR